jgi:hypothetical protein
MKVGLSVRIDVTKIDKERLYKGEKGTYLDLTTFVDTASQDQYENNGFISQSVDKEERDKDLEIQPIDYILGNQLGYCEGNVVKYVSRWQSKGGIDDRRNR